MDAAGNMALSAVQVLTAMATGAGTETGRALGDLIRARLGTSDEGRAALARVSAEPADPTAAQALQEAIREAIAADSEFQSRVAAALAGPPPAASPAPTISHSYEGSIVIGAGSKVRRSQISLGALTINNTRSARVSLTALAALLVALLALAAYGGAQVVMGDDSPGASSGTSPHSSRTASSGSSAPSPSGGASVPEVRDAALAEKILPGPDSLPDGWKFAGGSPQQGKCREGRVGSEEDGTLHYICKDSLLDLTAWYDPAAAAGFDKVHIEVVTYSSHDGAAQGYLGEKAEEANHPPGGVTEERLPTYCDEAAFFSASYPHINGLDGSVDMAEARSVFRCGTVMFNIYVINEHGLNVDLVTLTDLSRIVAGRAEQALRGETPTGGRSPRS